MDMKNLLAPGIAIKKLGQEREGKNKAARKQSVMSCTTPTKQATTLNRMAARTTSAA